jgi:hypothetical protein
VVIEAADDVVRRGLCGAVGVPRYPGSVNLTLDEPSALPPERIRVSAFEASFERSSRGEAFPDQGVERALVGPPSIPEGLGRFPRRPDECGELAEHIPPGGILAAASVGRADSTSESLGTVRRPRHGPARRRCRLAYERDVPPDWELVFELTRRAMSVEVSDDQQQKVTLSRPR